MLIGSMRDCETTGANHGVVVPIEAALAANSASFGACALRPLIFENLFCSVLNFS